MSVDDISDGVIIMQTPHTGTLFPLASVLALSLIHTHLLRNLASVNIRHSYKLVGRRHDATHMQYIILVEMSSLIHTAPKHALCSSSVQVRGWSVPTELINAQINVHSCRWSRLLPTTNYFPRVHTGWLPMVRIQSVGHCSQMWLMSSEQYSLI